MPVQLNELAIDRKCRLHLRCTNTRLQILEKIGITGWESTYCRRAIGRQINRELATLCFGLRQFYFSRGWHSATLPPADHPHTHAPADAPSTALPSGQR